MKGMEQVVATPIAFVRVMVLGYEMYGKVAGPPCSTLLATRAG